MSRIVKAEPREYRIVKVSNRGYDDYLGSKIEPSVYYMVEYKTRFLWWTWWATLGNVEGGPEIAKTEKGAREIIDIERGDIKQETYEIIQP